MNLKKLFSILITIAFFAANISCSSQSNGSGAPAGTGGNNPQSSGGTGGSSGSSASWQSVVTQMDASANVNSYQYPSVQIDPNAQTISLLIPFPSFFGINITPVLPSNIISNGVTISSTTMPDGSAAWEITVPLKYVLNPNKYNLQPLSGTLPNGSALPDFPQFTQISGIQITVPQQSSLQVTLYIVSNAETNGISGVAAFVSIPGFTSPYIPEIEYNILNKAQSNVGCIAIIPASGSYNGGVYVAAQIPSNIASTLNNLVSF